MKLLKATIIVCILTITCSVQDATASPNIDSLVPNSYEKQEFNDNKDLLRNGETKETKQISEEKQALTFEERSINDNENLVDTLFSNVSEPRKTVALQAEQYQLFSDEASSVATIQPEGEDEDGGLRLQTVYLIILAIAIITILALLVPKMAQGQPSSK
ncbi:MULTISPECIES: type VII secretion protein EssA [Cytobacillus]|uniref:Type VII secretion protein EssA n=1 Tax=Cytobacillus stercorigallinarum TaxID=2762240 RepID=A0ABR8QW80_9BACI|nr:type VII secretion protein EssA [Cytobacillus stercorigallinarum]MBD7939687.1 type VII secretion protein EssA [Cytobacillus stercorigallinarum]